MSLFYIGVVTITPRLLYNDRHRFKVSSYDGLIRGSFPMRFPVDVFVIFFILAVPLLLLASKQVCQVQLLTPDCVF